jgi:polyhydroxybutyrate depolymerase
MRFLVVLVLMVAAGPAMACGVKSDCRLGDRVYRVYVPSGDESRSRGAIFFSHGWRNSAAGTMGNRSLLKLADELDAVLIAPQSIGDDWKLPNRPREKDNTGEIEFTYFADLIDEAVKRYNVDRDRILMTGFSAGGMMSWNLACHRGELFAGFAPISGTFWAPVPQSCPSAPVNLMHFHGTGDGMVPLTGRPIADTSQGDVYKALALFKESGDFGEASSVPVEDLECERRENPDGKILEFCTHPGGHTYQASYVRRAWKAFGLDSES